MSEINSQTMQALRSDPRAAKREAPRTVRRLSDLQCPEPAPPAVVVPRLLSVIHALEASHKAGNAPSNLDPRKVALKADGSVGLITRRQIAADATVVLASSKYSSPEIVEGIAGELSADVPDSYVLGFVFYEILLGRELFCSQFAEVERQGELGWLSWHVDPNRRAQPLSFLIQGFPEALSELIDRMMTKSVERRVTSLATIGDTLVRSLEETTVMTNLSSLLGEAHDGRRSTLRGEITEIWHDLMARIWCGGRKILKKQAMNGVKKKPVVSAAGPSAIDTARSKRKS